MSSLLLHTIWRAYENFIHKTFMTFSVLPLPALKYFSSSCLFCVLSAQVKFTKRRNCCTCVYSCQKKKPYLTCTASDCTQYMYHGTQAGDMSASGRLLLLDRGKEGGGQVVRPIVCNQNVVQLRSRFRPPLLQILESVGQIRVCSTNDKWKQILLLVYVLVEQNAVGLSDSFLITDGS